MSSGGIIYPARNVQVWQGTRELAKHLISLLQYRRFCKKHDG
jgi:hypothetical protein